MKLSIIVPVYKVERTLERCIESILQQTYRDYQLILVDDASPDESPRICDKLAQRDHRIIVIHRKQNGGLSAARNSGIARSKGEYITFVDSDDYLGSDTLKPLMDLLAVHHDYDILEYSSYLHFGRPGRMNILRLDNREYTDMHKYWYDSQAFTHTYACNKIYRRTLFNQNTLFPEGRKFEDVFMLPQLLLKCHVVATTPLGYYYYCYNPDGITSQATGKDMQDLLDAHLIVLNMNSNPVLGTPTTAYFAQVLNVALDVYEMSGEFPSLPSFQSIVGKPVNDNIPFKIKLLKLFGLKNLCRINKLVHRIYRRNR